jgi:hypothetical protein
VVFGRLHLHIRLHWSIHTHVVTVISPRATMTQTKAAFIKIEGIPPGFEQTRPVEPEKRLPESEIRIEVCDESDAEKIVPIPLLP